MSDDGEAETGAETGGQTGAETGAAAAGIDRRLLEVLVCPVTRGKLVYDAERQELVSRGANRAFPIHDGIPIMLVDEARVLED